MSYDKEKARMKIDGYTMPIPESGCLLWMKAVKNNGYGVIALKVDGKWMRLHAHRVSYEVNVAPIPQGLNVLHKCDVRQCINPNHLFLGTQRDNNLDRFRKGRYPIPTRELHPRAKLNPEKVLFIKSSGLSSKELAAKFGITRQYVNDIKRARNGIWAEIKATQEPL